MIATIIILNFLCAAIHLFMAMVQQKFWFKFGYCLTAIVWLAVAIINIKTL